MSQTLFAIKGRLGITDYYVVTMKASEIVSQVKTPKDLPGWDNLTIEERYPRIINENRVKRSIAPYLANSKDRFFGSLLVAMVNAENSEFEPLENIKELPLAYRSSAESAGFLHLSGGEVLVPLDGQHRLRAIKYAIEGKDGDGKNIPDCPANLALANEDVVVILFAWEPKIARKIFTKVHKYAKPTTKGESLITDDDDIVAVITRKVANDIGARVVHFTSSTLSNKAKEFTTLATLYECTDYILDALHGKIDKTAGSYQDKNKVEMYYEDASEVWAMLTKGINHFREALHDTGEEGDNKRREQRQETLLAKPIAQLCLVRAFMRIKKECQHVDGSKLKDDEICGALNEIDWGMDNDAWQNILMHGNKIAYKNAVPLATDAIIYFSAVPMKKEDEEKFLRELERKYRANFSQTEEEQAKVQLPARAAGRIQTR